ncbi:MAG: N-acetylglucosamine-6-phosphate deacetylase [Cellvibrionaceae bacterium]
MVTALVGARVFDGHQFLDDYAVIINEGGIETLLPEEQLPQGISRLDLESGILAPGFIDLQVNGGGGTLFNNRPQVDTLEAMLTGHRASGTTTMLPTLISDSREQQQRGIDAVKTAIAQGEAGILGIHIEGPFFNLEKRGTHKADYIRSLTDKDIDWLCNNATDDLVTLVTLAPEQTQLGHIRRLSQAGIYVSAGHSNADHQQIHRAIEEGLVGFTHLFNAMRPMTARDPGVVGAALADRSCWCGIIADGHHVDSVSLQVAINAKPPGKVFLVTDAMATVGSDSKSFSIYGETISEDKGRLINAEGRLAGSAIGMIDAVKFCHTQMHLALEECLRMASLYPAQFIKRAYQLGRIRSGYRADLVHFDESFNVDKTWVNGNLRLHS